MCLPGRAVSRVSMRSALQSIVAMSRHDRTRTQVQRTAKDKECHCDYGTLWSAAPAMSGNLAICPVAQLAMASSTEMATNRNTLLLMLMNTEVPRPDVSAPFGRTCRMRLATLQGYAQLRSRARCKQRLHSQLAHIWMMLSSTACMPL